MDIDKEKIVREEINKLIDEIEKEIIRKTIKSKPIYELKDILNKKNLYQLKESAKLMGISKAYKMKKSELIEVLYDEVITEEHLMTVISYLTTQEYSVFQNAIMGRTIEYNSKLDDSHITAQDFLILQSFNFNEKIEFVVPREIENNYKKLKNNGLIDEVLNYFNVVNYLNSTANLYGTISVDDFLEIYNLQNNKKITKQELMSIIKSEEINDNFFDYNMGYIVHSCFDGILNEINENIISAEDKSRYIPEKEELLKYENEMYYETSPYSKIMIKFFIEEMEMDINNAMELVEDLVLQIKLGCRMQDLVDTIGIEYGEFESEEQTEKIIPILIDLFNNTRKWYNNGMLSKEMRERKKQNGNSPRKVVKIGRNEPCPCGSDKKYKKCCGK